MIGGLFKAFTLLGSEWVMWLMLFLSVASFAVIIERFRNLRNQERVGALLWKEQILSWMKGGIFPDSSEKVNEIVQKYPCIEADLLQVLLTAKNSNRNELEPLMASFLGHKRVELDKNLAFLGTMGSNCPFIGLFGTVLGIIKAFNDLGEKTMESGGAQGVSSGLSEALVATAVGLLVAIPAVLFFNFFQRKIKMTVARAESLGNFLISLK